MTKVKDPSCGMEIEKETAKFSAKVKGKDYYFCSKDCRDKFLANNTFKTTSQNSHGPVHEGHGSPPEKRKDGISKETMAIKDMHCASCAITIEKALKKVPGVESANVNYASAKASVAYDTAKANRGMLVEAIEKSGYGVVENDSGEKGKVVLKISGMESQHCVGIIENTLAKVDGVKSYRVNLATEKATVFFDPAKTNLAE